MPLYLLLFKLAIQERRVGFLEIYNIIGHLTSILSRTSSASVRSKLTLE
jgi:hypothetical protein